MKKVLLFLLFLSTFMSAQTLILENFEADLYSKKANLETKKISLNIYLEGRYVDDESHKIVDALNVIIGSFFAEDLITSKGKSSLKQTLTKFCEKEYGVDIDGIYINSLKIVDSVDLNELIRKLKEAGCIKD
ncbi:MAG: hypothetical protein M0P02_00695 [Sulfurospirillaceae bacterium]|jgi:hypothetical protein|nr:hypothetical protein [Sulfurospirillaceae bacterium]MCK9545583.1 hypothetical protein [Sulfurospirillaceae bacterium]MDY0238141.1 hypothetical protein [Campylobacterales bacterium]NLM98475.1 hypothetical protein [Campylobacteraceae bacterium]